MSYSKHSIPHYYVTVAVNVDNLLSFREKINNVAKSKISINDMVIKAASLACMKVPETNSSWMGNSIRKYKDVNMNVAIETGFGFLLPVINSVNRKGLDEIAA